MDKQNEISTYQLSLIASVPIVLLNPISIINKQWLQNMSADFRVCFQYDHVCNIGTYAELSGSALPYSLITFLIVWAYSNQKDNLKGFLVLMAAYSLAHALHA